MLKEDEHRDTGHEIAQGTHHRKKVSFIARRVIVKLAATDTDRSLAEVCEGVLADAEGAQMLRAPGQTGRMVVLIPEGESVPEWSKRLDGHTLVEYAEPDIVDTAQIVPNDPRYPEQWAPPLVDAEEAWDLETGKPNALIGIIDSGISITGSSLDHADLSTPGRFTLGTDFVDGGTPQDLNGHGTHVAGIAAAVGNNGAGIAGMNWNSPVYICRTLDANGNGSSADFADAVEEITDYAVANNLKAAINYSGGGGANLTKQQACQYASDRGMLVVAAAGNDNGGPVIWPAAYSTTITGVIAVGSTDSNDTVSSFSNVGPEVTVVAPGRNILSTTPTYTVKPTLPINYGTMSGTSMATPLVTGLAALMWSRHPGFANQKVKQCLQDTAVKLGSGTFDNSWGHGRVNAHAAVKCGDLVIAPSVLKACGPSVLKVCPASRLVRCPSRLPVLCPTTRLSACWSRLMLCVPITMVCPSAVDACPSAPGGCEWRPGELMDPIILRLTLLENRFRQLETERWYQASEAEEQTSEDGEGWFFIDDDGNVHEVG